MKKAKLTDVFVVICPHCDDYVRVSETDIDDVFMCDCMEEFIVTSNNKTINSKATNKCSHSNIKHGWGYSNCSDCGMFKTDSMNDWGVAKNMWFKSSSEAEFYKKNGRLPQ